jgi:Fe-S cluster assembly iron-binding protein IscA
MLAITDIAAEAIRTLANDAELPEGSGLRISAPDPEKGLELSLAGQPNTDDVVLAGDGVSVFLEPVVADVLDDKVLDVQPVQGPDGEQELRFAIGVQEQPPT